jgi:hypothetical protein
MTCSKCHKKIGSITGIGTAYAQTLAGNNICYACCAVLDKEDMRRYGEFNGYYVHERKPEVKLRFGERRYYHGANAGSVTNWPGSFIIPCYRAVRSVNNFGAERTDFWFIFEGREWHGVNIGDNQIARCKQKKG